VLVVALAAPLAALADYKTYARGQEAAADGKWGEVEEAMQAALAENATPKVRVKLYGQRFAPYVPQYYLGLAAYRQNDCTGALRWFNDASASPVIAQVAEFRGVADAARSDCNAKLAAAQKPSVPGPSTPTTAGTGTTPAKPTPTDPRPVAGTAGTATPTRPTPTPPTTSAQTPATTTGTAQLPVAPTVPPALQSALQNWLAGRYRGVVAGSTAGVQGKALAHLHLLRAAAYFGMSELQANEAATLRASAEAEVRNARRALAAISPDGGYYSPRFRQFFASVRP
jgi:hypothetical protein